MKKNTQLSCFFSIQVFSLIFSCLPSSVLSLLLHLVSSFISDLLFFIWSFLVYSFPFFSCLVLSLFLCFSLSLSVSVSLSLSPCGGVWCVCCVLCVLVWLLLLCGVWWCVVCGGVWCVVWHAEKTSVCRFKTSPCVPAPRPHVSKHAGVVPVHTGTFGIYTRRFLDGHTGRGEGRERGRGCHRQFCLPRLVHVVITCSRGSPKETSGSSPLSV